jgi:hypothetical protein
MLCPILLQAAVERWRATKVAISAVAARCCRKGNQCLEMPL